MATYNTTYNDWFPMDDHPGVTGAYMWLTNKGYGPVSKAIKERSTFRTADRRPLLIGLIYHESLLSGFLSTCWTQGNRGTIERLKKMDTWHKSFVENRHLVNWLAPFLS